MKKYKTLITVEAENDLFDIYDYIATNDSNYNAQRILNQLEGEYLKLEIFPKRGRIVPELRKINITTYLEVIHNPFRIIYQIFNDQVFIHAILDGRRDLEELLYNRLIRI